MKVGILITSSGTLEPEIYRNHIACINYWATLYDLRVYHVYDTQQQDALNVLVENAMADECEYLFFMEHDNIYCKDTLGKLLEHKVDFVSGYYPYRNWPYAPIPVVMEDGEAFRFEYIPHKDETESKIEVELACLGCSLVKASVFIKLSKPYFDLKLDDKSKKFMLSDVVFFKNLRKAGVKVLVDGNVRIGHLSHRFSITPDNYKIFQKMVQVCFPEFVSPEDRLDEDIRIKEIIRILKG
jgi:hypothetical protein